MEQFAVSVLPVANIDEWRQFATSIESGERAEAHREFLRRLGVKREHVRLQQTPAGAVMVLVWEGVDQDRVGGSSARCCRTRSPSTSGTCATT